MAVQIYDGGKLVVNELVVTDTVNVPAGQLTGANLSAGAAIATTQLAQRTFAKHTIPLHTLRVHDALQTLLPTSAGTDDLGLVPGTFGTNAPKIKSSNASSTSVTQYARFLFPMPPNYEAAESVRVAIEALMEVVSDTSATLDVECYRCVGDGTLSADLCATSAQSINSATVSRKNFTITSSAIEAGDVLDVRITVAITDAATGAGVIANLPEITVELDTRG
jgi:hypothetical protein